MKAKGIYSAILIIAVSLTIIFTAAFAEENAQLQPKLSLLDKFKICQASYINPFGLYIDINNVYPLSPESLWSNPIVFKLGGVNTCDASVESVTMRITQGKGALVKGDMLSEDGQDGMEWNGTNNKGERVTPVLSYYAIANVFLKTGEMIVISRPIHFRLEELTEEHIIKVPERDVPVNIKENVNLLNKVRVITTGGFDYLGIVKGLTADRYVIEVDYTVLQDGKWDKQNSLTINIPTKDVNTIYKFNY